LEQVVGVLAAVHKFLDNGEDKAQVAADKLLARSLVAVLDTQQERVYFVAFEDLQLRRVHAADFNLVQHCIPPKC